MGDWTLSERFEVGDGSVRWTVFGDGPPLVLLHGTPFSSYIWRDIAPVLARGHRVYVWDMLGFGQSSRAVVDVSLRRQATIFADLLEHWSVSAPRVVAHDVGGAVALRATLLHDVPFASLTLIDAATVNGWGSGGFFQTIHEHPEVFEALPEWASAALIDAKIRSGSHTGLRAEALASYTDQWAGAEGARAFYQQYAQGGEDATRDLQDRFGLLDIPLHVIWGEDDAWLGLDYAERLATALPDHARLSVVRGAGHAVPEDQPDELLRLLGA
ncbi:pimeloyl-ACP methyl ester carboxylesterase [Curtobacterium sp. JUb34]|uniref:alpha/beta fold hydrolase n=1 Tax=Curtobacterium sp. JUb34 TaxID=2485109 RepID=UPI000F484090|nr:alpha/beta hydrolase [Curtobacterium sp. JUb34]ROR28859.1 pimeloyl-ACP methyl ester carboxylesterase [Curtobacterium sp. JUb34]